MNANQVQEQLIEVLQSIQAASGLECPALTGAVKPIEALPKFDSKIWPVAVGMLGAKLGIEIPPDVNIFRRDKTTMALSIDEAVQIVLDLTKSQLDKHQKQVGAA